MLIHAMTRNRGISLMEVLVVIAIIAGLATIGYPSFVRSKLEAKRADAHVAIAKTEALIERYLAENNKALFDSDDLALTQFSNYDSTSIAPVLSEREYYRITIVPDSTGYIITATATIDDSLTSCTITDNALAGQCRDTVCREIILDHGVKKSKNSLGVDADAATTLCW